MENDKLKLLLPSLIYNKIEEEIVNLHIDLELSIPVNPYKVANSLNFIVRPFSDLFEDERRKLNLLLGTSNSGLSYFDPNLKTYIIWVNDLNSMYKQRINFTIMHEIGHIRMGHRCDSPLAEIIANFYAAYALIPSPLPSLFNCSSSFEIAKRFDVSPDCASRCQKRCEKWEKLNRNTKHYEDKLLEYYKNVLHKDRRWYQPELLLSY
ncbi:MAG: ImmA/IrrE family metallo-endopeptidase [bacterium]|nr:ImmA/IrrE family metallo-endopeptidase [bacterium]